MTTRPLPFQSPAMHEVDALLEACLASTSRGILIVDRSCRVLRYNDRLLDLWQITPGFAENATGEELLEHVRHRIEDWDAFRDDLRQLREHPEEERYGEQIALNDGSVLSRSTRPIVAADGTVLGRLWEYEDQTDAAASRRALRRLEAHLRETETELKALRRAHSELERSLEQAQRSESLSLFADGVAHDFNNLLVGMLGNLSIARSELDEGSRLGELLEEVRDAGEQASELIHQMLEFAGRSEPQPKRYDVSKMIDDTYGILHSAVHSDCAINLDLAEELPLIEVDATRIRQVLVNLVTNGSEALHGTIGMIEIATCVDTLDADRLEAAAVGSDREPGRYVGIRVTDSGSGIDPEARDSMFEPFFTTRLGGRGLGLTAVRSILEEHGGVLEVASEAGSGSTFAVWLPAIEVEEPAAEAPAERDDDGRPWSGSGKILLVDDNFTVLEVGRRMLEMLGFEVETRQSGFDAVEELRQRPTAFRAAIVDLTMPQIDGSETARQLRELAPDLPIIMSSGYSELEVTSRAVAGSSYLQKPYSLDELRDRLQSLEDARSGQDSEDWLD